MKLVVGLGNPGAKYVGTRHNIGFAVLDEVARRAGAGIRRTSFQGEVVDVTIGSARAWLLWPHTFMNRSGGSVWKALEFYKLPRDALLVVCDDFNLPLGKLRIRTKGSSGGQKGLEDIIRQLGDEEFARLRVGVGEVPAGRSGADFVLSKFTKPELPEIEAATWRAADAVETFVREGVESCMNRYNQAPA